MSRPNGILSMNPEKYREIDGVVFDLDSYARHCRHQPAEPVQKSVSAAPKPVFETEPRHNGWYAGERAHPPAPVMGGALPPCGRTDGVQTVTLFTGSGSFVSSYFTSWYSSGSFAGGSGVYPAGGYGLELI